MYNDVFSSWRANFYRMRNILAEISKVNLLTGENAIQKLVEPLVIGLIWLALTIIRVTLVE